MTGAATLVPETGLAFHVSPSWLDIPGRLVRFRGHPVRFSSPLLGAHSFQVLISFLNEKRLPEGSLFLFYCRRPDLNRYAEIISGGF